MVIILMALCCHDAKWRKLNKSYISAKKKKSGCGIQDKERKARQTQSNQP